MIAMYLSDYKKSLPEMSDAELDRSIDDMMNELSVDSDSQPDTILFFQAAMDEQTKRTLPPASPPSPAATDSAPAR